MWQNICLSSEETVTVKVNCQSELLILSLNIILLIEGKRLAYRACSLPSLLPKILELTGDRLVVLPLIPEEPLVMLKENLQRVVDIFTVAESRDIAYGRVLDYPHIGSGSRDCMIVSYCVGDALALYSFQVPNSRYTREVRDKIEADLVKYRATLSLYGYDVKLFIFQNERPGETTDALPEL